MRRSSTLQHAPGVFRVSPTPTSPQSDRASTSPIAHVAQPSFSTTVGAVFQASPRTPPRAPSLDRAHTSSNLSAELDELMGSSSGDEENVAEPAVDGLFDFFAAADVTRSILEPEPQPPPEVEQEPVARAPEVVSEPEQPDLKPEPESGPEPEPEPEPEALEHGPTLESMHSLETESETQPEQKQEQELEDGAQPDSQPGLEPVPDPQLEISRPSMAAGTQGGHGDDERVFCCCGRRKHAHKIRQRGDVRYQRVQIDEGDE